MTDEPRYTLAEAERELARKECRRYGHSFDVITTEANNISGDPQMVYCSRKCGAGPWHIRQSRPSVLLAPSSDDQILSWAPILDGDGNGPPQDQMDATNAWIRSVGVNPDDVLLDPHPYVVKVGGKWEFRYSEPQRVRGRQRLSFWGSEPASVERVVPLGENPDWPAIGPLAVLRKAASE